MSLDRIFSTSQGHGTRFQSSSLTMPIMNPERLFCSVRKCPSCAVSLKVLTDVLHAITRAHVTLGLLTATEYKNGSSGL
jgi:hypothetical protein